MAARGAQLKMAAMAYRIFMWRKYINGGEK